MRDYLILKCKKCPIEGEFESSKKMAASSVAIASGWRCRGRENWVCPKCRLDDE